MPKLRKSPEQIADASCRAVIDRQAELFDLEREELIKQLGFSASTFYERRKHPENLSLKELRRIVKVLDLSIEQVCQILAIPYKVNA